MKNRPKDLKLSRTDSMGRETLFASVNDFKDDPNRVRICLDADIGMNYRQWERLHQWVIEARAYAISKGLRS